jgi:hypothetical protein
VAFGVHFARHGIVWLLVAGLFARLAAADDGVLLYASDESPTVRQQLATLCSTLRTFRWQPPTFIINSRQVVKLLDSLDAHDSGASIPLQDARTPEAAATRKLIDDLTQQIQSPSTAPASLEQCSVGPSAAARIQMVVSFEESKKDYLHIQVSQWRDEQREPRYAGPVQYDPGDGTVLLYALAGGKTAGILSGTLEIQLPASARVTVTPIEARATPTDLNTSAYACDRRSDTTQHRARFCNVPVGRYHVITDICAGQREEVLVNDFHVSHALSCSAPPASEGLAPEFRARIEPPADTAVPMLQHVEQTDPWYVRARGAVPGTLLVFASAIPYAVAGSKTNALGAACSGASREECDFDTRRGVVENWDRAHKIMFVAGSAIAAGGFLACLGADVCAWPKLLWLPAGASSGVASGQTSGWARPEATFELAGTF